MHYGSNSGGICFVIAKSVDLEQIEERLDQVLDEVEGLSTRLERGWLTSTDKRLARMASTILSFNYASLANIMAGLRTRQSKDRFCRFCRVIAVLLPKKVRKMYRPDGFAVDHPKSEWLLDNARQCSLF